MPPTGGVASPRGVVRPTPGVIASRRWMLRLTRVLALEGAAGLELEPLELGLDERRLSGPGRRLFDQLLERHGGLGQRPPWIDQVHRRIGDGLVLARIAGRRLLELGL